MKKTTIYNLFHFAALVLLLAGGAGSLIYMFNAGRHQNSILLIMLFTGWVLSPFVVLSIADMTAKRKLIKTRIIIHLLMIFITLFSLISYSGALNLPGTKPAFKFLVVPLISLLLIFILIAIIRKRSGEHNIKN